MYVIYSMGCESHILRCISKTAHKHSCVAIRSDKIIIHPEVRVSSSCSVCELPCPGAMIMHSIYYRHVLYMHHLLTNQSAQLKEDLLNQFQHRLCISMLTCFMDTFLNKEEII